jgi:superfamily I DNA/RNA helicase
VAEVGEDREALLEPELASVQLAVIESGSPAILVEGPPGSGKSGTLRRRVVRIAGAGEAVSAIAMVVPTRLAREVNRAKLQVALTEPYDELVVETPALIAERLLRGMAPAAGLDPEKPPQTWPEVVRAAAKAGGKVHHDAEQRREEKLAVRGRR